MTHHRRGLRRLLGDDQLAEAIENDFETANITERQRTILEYARKLTLKPAEMTQGDVAALKNAGLSDLDILHVAEVVGYYAYVNRIADGLGVTLENEHS